MKIIQKVTVLATLFLVLGFSACHKDGCPGKITYEDTELTQNC